MRFSRLILSAFICLSLSACGESEANKANKKAIAENSSEINLRLAHASESAGDLGSAERQYKDAFQKTGDMEARLELADFYKRHNGASRALALLEEARKIEPDNTEILRRIANIDIDMGNAAKALKVVNQAIDLKGDDALLYNTKGVALDMSGKYGEARKAYKKALDLDPENIMMFNANLGMSYIMSGSYNKAIELLSPLAEEQGATPQIRQNLALAYGMKGDSGTAEKLLSKDLSSKDVQDNVKFYNRMAAKNAAQQTGEVPASEEDDTPETGRAKFIPPIP